MKRAFPILPIKAWMHKVSGRISSRFSTTVLSSSKGMPWNEPVQARIILPDGLKLISGEQPQVKAHLQGWGDHDAMMSLLFARSTADHVRHLVEWVVQGKGRAVIRAGSARVGHVEAQVEVG